MPVGEALWQSFNKLALMDEIPPGYPTRGLHTAHRAPLLSIRALIPPPGFTPDLHTSTGPVR